MAVRTNSLGQAIGFAVENWRAPPPPSRSVTLEGRSCRLEPLDAERHARDLHEANSRDTAGRMWTYMGYGPFAALQAYTAWVKDAAAKPDPFFYAIIDKASGKALGVASLLRIDPPNGVIEVGHIAYAPALQKTVAATEAMYLMMKHVFDLGYRRYEWKCDFLNEPSRQAAARLGFTYEGRFRQAVMYKGRNRDTDWFSIIDKEWPTLRDGFEAWLAPSNFDAEGRQKKSLAVRRP
ncbi:MAG: GNAT family N-acetyltransferase [Hyphomicrobiaceae bacterium]|nr:MAG: GNAT family N-acetyltransferase [Hyphomicrobiaceae bacterium]